MRKHLAKVPSRILETTATLRPAVLIEKQRDLAELWHWRSRTRRLQEEGRMPTMLDSRALTIERVLQLSSAKAAEEGMAPPPIDGDFPAFGKPYRSLTPDEFSIATSIAMERHRADWWFNIFFATRSSDLYEADGPILHSPSYSDDSVPRILPRDSQKPTSML